LRSGSRGELQVDCAARLEASSPLLGAKRHLMYGALTQPFRFHYRVLIKFSFGDNVYRFLKLILMRISAHTTCLVDYYLFLLFPLVSLNVFYLLESFGVSPTLVHAMSYLGATYFLTIDQYRSTRDHRRSRCKGWILWPTPYTIPNWLLCEMWCTGNTTSVSYKVLKYCNVTLERIQHLLRYFYL
jgi:hypothetical protein